MPFMFCLTALPAMTKRNSLRCLNTQMGRTFAQTGSFEKAAVDAFAGPEYMPEKQIRMYNLFGWHISRFFMGRIAKKLGCKEKLDARPYERATRMRK